MTNSASTSYFFSLQPFWNNVSLRGTVQSERISVSQVHLTGETMYSVPGNGQVGIVLRGPEEFAGVLYGVAKQRGEIPLHGVQEGYFVRFAPGVFSSVFGIPSAGLPAEGIDLGAVLSPAELSRLRNAIAQEHPQERLLELLENWDASAGPVERDSALASQVLSLIWDSRGAHRVKEMEQETGYSARRLQEVVTREVGLAPKQMCRHIRFQNALQMLFSGAEKVNQAQAAQLLGYSDQSHYNREFKEFSGFCPSQFAKMFSAK